MQCSTPGPGRSKANSLANTLILKDPDWGTMSLVLLHMKLRILVTLITEFYHRIKLLEMIFQGLLVSMRQSSCLVTFYTARYRHLQSPLSPGHAASMWFPVSAIGATHDSWHTIEPIIPWSCSSLSTTLGTRLTKPSGPRSQGTGFQCLLLVLQSNGYFLKLVCIL